MWVWFAYLRSSKQEAYRTDCMSDRCTEVRVVYANASRTLEHDASLTGVMKDFDRLGFPGSHSKSEARAPGDADYWPLTGGRVRLDALLTKP